MFLLGAAWAQSAVISFSDVHFNPFDQSSLVAALQSAPASQWKAVFESGQSRTPSSYGEETNFPLLNSALAAMAKQEPDPAYVFLTGDLLAHKFSELYQAATGDQSQDGLRSFIKKTVTFLADYVSQTFSDATVYFILGNNDSYNGDYRIAPEGQFLADASEILAQRFLAPEYRQDFSTTFAKGGYYNLPLPGSEASRIIGLNTIFFSVNYQDPGETKVNYDPAAQQLAWLEDQLKSAQAQGEKVMILAHIPPGVNVYGTVHDPQNTTDRVTQVSGFWKSDNLATFLNLLQQYEATIQGIFSGHTHMDDFRLYFEPGDRFAPLAFVHITPAISPQFGNNPGFKLLDMDPARLRLNDSTTYYLNLAEQSPAWSKEYSFQEAFGKSGINRFNLSWIYGRLAWDPKIQSRYMTYYNVSNQTSPFDPKDLRAYWAGIGNLTAGDYQDSFNAGQGPKLSSRPGKALLPSVPGAALAGAMP